MKLKHLMGVLLVLLLGSGIAKAQTEYGFYICGVKVNSENVNKLNEIKGVTVGAGGHISYSPETNTLSIKDVSMQPERGGKCLYVSSAYKNLPFTLHLEGKNQFNATDETAFWTECDTRIEGSGKLFIRTNNAGIFVLKDATLAIEDCSLEIVSETDEDGYVGIEGGWATQPKLVIKNASIYAKTSKKEGDHYPYAIGGFESITLEGSVITQPSNAEIGSYTFSWGGTYTKQFVMSGDKPAKEVRIKAIPYEFSICGVGVNSGNLKKLNEIKGVTVGAGGHISYSPETNTLSIKDVSMQAEEGERCLYVYSAYENLPFTLHLEGKNQFNATDETAFWTECDTRIEGSGELFIRTNHYGIFVHHDATLAIEDCSLEIVSETDGEGYTGISGYWHTQPKLVIKNASIYAKASGKEVGHYPYAIGGFESITLEGSVITQPSNAEIGSYTFYWDGASHTKQFVMSDGKPAKEVRIERTSDLYNFSICGVEVNSRNVKKLNEIKGVTVGAGGHISYSPETNTLSIKDVTLQPSEGVFAVYVDCQSDDQLFTLSLEGENQFNIVSNCLPLYTDADMRIDGSGKLSIRTKGTGIFVANDATMTIEDCTLDIVSDTNGDGRACIDANCSERSHLMIKNASIYAKSSGKENAYYPYAIGGFESILLGGVTITEPRDGVVGSYTVQMGENYYTKQFIMSGDKPAKEVKIMKTLAVEEVDVADLRVYPNPATHYVQVEGAKAGASIALYSLEGIRLLAAEANEAGAVELDLSTLPAGNYVVKAGGKHLKLSVKH